MYSDAYIMKPQQNVQKCAQDQDPNLVEHYQFWISHGYCGCNEKNGDDHDVSLCCLNSHW